jgi:gamma-glutamylcyclotransferase (GGCT)/AIG2-like uncharacterized protein YtfP
MEAVFAYGILMRDGDTAAKLPGYRLDFGYHATVVADEEAVTYGALIRNVDTVSLWAYDAIEGYREGRPWESYYDRVAVTVTTAQGAAEAAWVYVMNASDLAAARKRFDRFDLAYIQELMERMEMQYGRLGHGEEAYAALRAAAMRLPR